VRIRLGWLLYLLRQGLPCQSERDRKCRNAGPCFGSTSCGYPSLTLVRALHLTMCPLYPSHPGLSHGSQAVRRGIFPQWHLTSSHPPSKPH
jgi:hypothetical protein